ncbi:MAG: extracellular solute-binding protein, partial [Dactylosporangium sp.]|nr:extracellular solute-binding protein [Dactylosporangium sp.]NNJ61126.1 extracellular solute-binding protein [Dactylosporangium sp.]
MSRPARRATALLLATVGVALTTTACGALERAQTTVTVMTSWEATSPEARTFVKVAERYAKDHGFAVAYQGVRAGEAMLEAASANGSPPDIAMLSSPAALASYAGKDIGGLVDLQPDDTIEAAQLLYRADRTDRPYGVIVKTDLKSLVWHASPSLASDYPDTWRELVALGGGLPRDRDTTPWCLGMADGSGSGWVGTDWIEDILLHQSGIEVYRRWATGELPWNSPQVRSAWRAWGDLLVASGGTDAATTATILQTGWADAGRGMFDAEAGVPRCA